MTSLPIDAFLDQLRIIRILLSRPAIQVQMWLLVILIATAWGLGRLLQPAVDRWWQKRFPEQSMPDWLSKGVPYLYWPLLALVLGLISAETILKSRIVSLTLYYSLLNLFWFLLFYRLLVGILYVKMTRVQAQRYHYWLLTPFILFVFVVLFVRVAIGSSSILQQIPLLTIGEFSLTIGTLASTLIIIYVTIILSWISQDILHHFIAPQLDNELNVIHVFDVIIRYTVIGSGILLALRALGLDFSTFALIGGGLSVGIGFGLQNIVANFFAGIFLLFEQALRPGDVINLEGETGVVEKLNIRSTVIRTYDNVEVIVPNETFLTSKLVSYTKSDRTIRLSLPVGAGYDSDPEQVAEILVAVGKAHEDVLSNPTPIVYFKGFGDSSIDFILTVWVNNPIRMPYVRSDLYFAIWKQFAQHQIEIPFPQHDLNLRRGWEQLE